MSSFKKKIKVSFSEKCFFIKTNNENARIQNLVNFTVGRVNNLKKRKKTSLTQATFLLALDLADKLLLREEEILSLKKDASLKIKNILCKTKKTISEIENHKGNFI